MQQIALFALLLSSETDSDPGSMAGGSGFRGLGMMLGMMLFRWCSKPFFERGDMQGEWCGGKFFCSLFLFCYCSYSGTISNVRLTLVVTVLQ
jgi:hypothetical protein